MNIGEAADKQKGLYMGLFSKWKERREEKRKTQDYLSEQAEHIEGEELNSGKRIQHFVIESCEQIIEITKEIEEEKNEYRVVTDYLTDIQTLEDLPPEEMQAIVSAAESVWKLEKLRDEFQNAEKHISDVQFVQMQQEEDHIPDAIKRLQTNEAYQNTIKKDMNYLESEKTEWYYNKLELLREQKILKNLAVALFAVFGISLAVLLVIQAEFKMDFTYIWMGMILAAAAGAFFIFIRMSSNQTEIKRSEINMNHAIVLLNKVKFKYVNVTNAVEYAREKYHVKNAKELNYMWEQYLNELKEREKFRQTNEDLEYFNNKLVRLLKKYRLYDARVWTNQASALVDKKEMVEVKHNLLVRRQKLRNRIEYNMECIRERRAEVDRLLKKKNIYTPEIKEILESIDNISGN